MGKGSFARNKLQYASNLNVFCGRKESKNEKWGRGGEGGRGDSGATQWTRHELDIRAQINSAQHSTRL